MASDTLICGNCSAAFHDVAAFVEHKNCQVTSGDKVVCTAPNNAAIKFANVVFLVEEKENGESNDTSMTTLAIPTITPGLPSTTLAIPTITPGLPSTTLAIPTITPPLPSTSPSIPTTTPGIPTTIPGLPTTIPGIPTTTPGIPTTIPGIPTTTPGIPTTTPGIPTTTPGSPTTTPGILTTTPGILTTIPGILTTTPGLPTTTPGILTTIPGLPTTRPTGKKRGRPRKSTAAAPMTALSNTIAPNTPISGGDGVLLCKKCQRSFHRLRHFASHKCLHDDFIDYTKKGLSFFDTVSENDMEERNGRDEGCHTEKELDDVGDKDFVVPYLKLPGKRKRGRPRLYFDNRNIHENQEAKIGVEGSGLADVTRVSSETVQDASQDQECSQNVHHDMDVENKFTPVSGCVQSSVVRRRGRPRLYPKPALPSVSPENDGVDFSISSPFQDISSDKVPKGSIKVIVDTGQVQLTSSRGRKRKSNECEPHLAVFNTETDKLAFEDSLNVDLSHVDHMFNVHILEQEVNHRATGVRPASNSLYLYSCKTCDKVFKTLSLTRLHVLIHTDLRPFKCPRCHFASNCKGNLYTHIRRHTGQYYRCKSCSFKSVNRGHVIEHELTHSGIKERCAVCERVFSTRKSLVNHVRVYHRHTPDGKQYLLSFLAGRQEKGMTIIHQCHLCNRKFKKRADRDRHLFTHDVSESPFLQKCDVCEYSTTRKGYIEKHFLKHRIIYKCCECNMPHLSSIRLIAHLLSRHSHTDVSCYNSFKQSIAMSLFLPEVTGSQGQINDTCQASIGSEDTAGHSGDSQVASGQSGDSQVASGLSGDSQVASGQSCDSEVASGQSCDFQVTTSQSGDSKVASGQSCDSEITTTQPGDILKDITNGMNTFISTIISNAIEQIRISDNLRSDTLTIAGNGIHAEDHIPVDMNDISVLVEKALLEIETEAIAGTVQLEDACDGVIDKSDGVIGGEGYGVIDKSDGVIDGEGDGVINGEGEAVVDEGDGVIDRGGDGLIDGEGDAVVDGEGDGVIDGEGDAVVDGEGDGVIDGEGDAVIDGEGDGVIDGEGDAVIDGEGDAVVDGEGDAVIDGEGDGVIDGEGDAVIDGEGDAVIDGEGDAVIDGEGDAVIDGEGDAVVDGEGDGLIDGEGDAVIDGEGDGVIDGEGDAVIDGEGDAVVDGEGDGLIDGEGDGVIDGEGDAVIDGEGDAVIDGEGDGVIDGEGDAVIDGEGDAVVDGEGDAVIDGEGDAVVDGEGDAVVDGEGDAVVDGEGDAVVDKGGDGVEELTHVSDKDVCSGFKVNREDIEGTVLLDQVSSDVQSQAKVSDQNAGCHKDYQSESDVCGISGKSNGTPLVSDKGHQRGGQTISYLQSGNVSGRGLELLMDVNEIDNADLVDMGSKMTLNSVNKMVYGDSGPRESVSSVTDVLGDIVLKESVECMNESVHSNSGNHSDVLASRGLSEKCGYNEIVQFESDRIKDQSADKTEASLVSDPRTSVTLGKPFVSVRKVSHEWDLLKKAIEDSSVMDGASLESEMLEQPGERVLNIGDRLTRDHSKGSVALNSDEVRTQTDCTIEATGNMATCISEGSTSMSDKSFPDNETSHNRGRNNDDVLDAFGYSVCMTDDYVPFYRQTKDSSRVNLVSKFGYCRLNLSTFRELRDLFGNEECEFCGHLFHYKKDRDGHILTHTGERPFACDLCDYRSNTKGNLQHHIDDQHMTREYACTECDFRAPTRLKLWNHKLKHKPSGRKYVCRICDVNLTSGEDLKNHVTDKHSELSEAGKSFMLNDCKRPHSKLGKASYKCPYCQRVFQRSWKELQKHIWMHEGIKPFKCQVCPYACRSSHNLQTHMIRHSMDKPFKCQVCDKAFKSQTAMRCHERAHSVGNSFKCHKCPYSATQASHLSRHLETHNIKKRFACDLCDFTANTPTYMKMHYTKKHNGYTFHDTGKLPEPSVPDRPTYQCITCDFIFGNLSDFKRHLKSKHDMTNDAITQSLSPFVTNALPPVSVSVPHPLTGAQLPVVSNSVLPVVSNTPLEYVSVPTQVFVPTLQDMTLPQASDDLITWHVLHTEPPTDASAKIIQVLHQQENEVAPITMQTENGELIIVEQNEVIVSSDQVTATNEYVIQCVLPEIHGGLGGDSDTVTLDTHNLTSQMTDG